MALHVRKGPSFNTANNSNNPSSTQTIQYLQSAGQTHLIITLVTENYSSIYTLNCPAVFHHNKIIKKAGIWIGVFRIEERNEGGHLN